MHGQIVGLRWSDGCSIAAFSLVKLHLELLNLNSVGRRNKRLTESRLVLYDVSREIEALFGSF